MAIQLLLGILDSRSGNKKNEPAISYAIKCVTAISELHTI